MLRLRPWVYGAGLLFVAACSSSSPPPDQPSSGNAGSGGAPVGGAGGGGAAGSASTGTLATPVPLGTKLEETTDGAFAGDSAYANDFCGNPDMPASLKPFGTIVRVQKSLRYFVCIQDWGAASAVLIQTNIPGDPVQGFVPYATLFTYSDAQHPNTARAARGGQNFALLVINILNDYANSACSGSNDVFNDIRIGGGAATDLCSNVPTKYRVDGTQRFVDVTFPGGQMQSFELTAIPFVPPP